MKKFLLISLMCAVSLAGFAQKKNQPSTMAVSATNMNVLFIAVANPIDIAVSGYKDEDLIVTSEDAAVEKLGNGKYTIMPRNSQPLIVTVSAKTKRGTVELGQREFRAKQVPDPRPYLVGLGDIKNGEITKAELCTAIGVAAYLQTDLDFGFKITSFYVTINNGGYDSRLYSKDGLFTAEQKSVFEKLKPGDKVYIEDIKCAAIDGSTRDLGTLAFKIKELD